MRRAIAAMSTLLLALSLAGCPGIYRQPSGPNVATVKVVSKSGLKIDAVDGRLLWHGVTTCRVTPGTHRVRLFRPIPRGVRRVTVSLSFPAPGEYELHAEDVGGRCQWSLRPISFRHAPGALTVALSWQTTGDMDLHIIEPDGEHCWSNHKRTRSGGQLLNDVLRGPGAEMYMHPNPPAGPYRIEGVYYSGGPPTAATARAWRGDNLLGTYQATFTEARVRRHIHTIHIGGAEAGPSAATDPQAQDTGRDLTVTLRWQTQGTDVDLHVIDPQGKDHIAVTDVLRGPGQESCIIREPAPGEYIIAAKYYDSAGGQTTPVTVEVRLRGQLLGTYNATLTRQGEVRAVKRIRVP